MPPFGRALLGFSGRGRGPPPQLGMGGRGPSEMSCFIADGLRGPFSRCWGCIRRGFGGRDGSGTPTPRQGGGIDRCPCHCN